MNFDPVKMQVEIYANWLRACLRNAEDPLVDHASVHPSDHASVHPSNRAPLLLDLRIAAGHHTAGHDVKGAFRLAGLPDPARGTEPWARVAYVCAPDLHEVDALRAVREAGPPAQEAVVSAYLLGGVETAELLILEVMTTPGGFFS